MSYKSLTINERYNILKEFGKIEKENTDALIQWRNDMSLLSQKQFQKMLQYNQYDKKIFSYAVTREPDENIVKLYEKSEVEHIWRCTYWEILNTNILYEEKSYWGQDEGFNYIVRHFVKYVEMRKNQKLVVEKLCQNIRLLHDVPIQAHAISHFIEDVSIKFHESNTTQELMQKLTEMQTSMQKEPLPVTRTEFENRAVLYRILYDLEELITIKKRFIETLTPDEIKRFWNTSQNCCQ